MIYATITLFTILILYFIFQIRTEYYRLYIPICGVILVIFSSLREITGSTDVYNYMRSYDIYSSQTYGQLWQLYMDQSIKDGGYYIIAKFFENLGFPFRFFLVLIAIAYVFIICKFIQKYSDLPYISMEMWFSLTWFMFSLTGLRQTIAITIVMVAYFMKKRGKRVLFLILVGVACLIHNSAAVFFIVIITDKIRIRFKSFIIITAISLVISNYFPNIFRELINILAWNDNMEVYAESTVSLNMTGFIIQFCILLFLYTKYNSLTKKNNNMAEFYTLATLGLAMQAFSNIVGEMFRISMYFSIFSIVLVPNAIVCYKGENRKYFEIGIFAMLLFYFFVSGQYAGYDIMI